MLIYGFTFSHVIILSMFLGLCLNCKRFSESCQGSVRLNLCGILNFKNQDYSPRLWVYGESNRKMLTLADWRRAFDYCPCSSILFCSLLRITSFTVFTIFTVLFLLSTFSKLKWSGALFHLSLPARLASLLTYSALPSCLS